MSNDYQDVHVSDEEREALIAIGTNLRKDLPIIPNDKLFNKQSDVLGFVADHGHVVSLGLCNLRLEAIPDEVQQFKFLVKFSMNNNKLEHLPEWLGELTSMKELQIESNGIVEIPESFGNLVHVEKLDFYYNNLAEIPLAIQDFSSLRVLNLERNKIRVIPDRIDHLGMLQDLNLSDNEIKEIPDTLGNLKQLTKLDLSRNHKISEIPDCIGDLKNLLKLKVDHNKIIRVSGTIGELSSIEVLDFDYNQLSTIPLEVSRLAKLQSLFLSNNQISSIPWYLWTLNKLETLSLGDNPLVDDEMEIAKQDVKSILQYCKKKAPINVFIAMAENEVQSLNIKAIAEFLSKQPEIQRVFTIDEHEGEFLEEFVSRILLDCQLVLFVGTRESIFESSSCTMMLDTARQLGIEVIPIKGMTASWADLNALDLSRQLGIEFTMDDLGEFCIDLYKYITKYKRAIDLFDRERAVIGKQIMECIISLKNYVNSMEFKETISRNYNMVKSTIQEFEKKKISIAELFSRMASVLPGMNPANAGPVLESDSTSDHS